VGRGEQGGWTTAARGGVLRRRQEEPEAEQRAEAPGGRRGMN
jgi:hypothetical protein